MSLVTLEVTIDHGRITPAGPESLPAHARGLLTLLPEPVTGRDPLQPDPALQRVRFLEDPTSPLQPGDWPESEV